VNVGRIVPEACQGSGRLLEDLAAVLYASHLTSTSGSQIAVIIEPATRAELGPVIAAG
jgi:hypothetical protein